MNITVTESKRQEPMRCSFGGMKIGTAFTTDRMLVWLKTEEDFAVDVADGVKSHFHDSEIVLPVKATLTWECL